MPEENKPNIGVTGIIGIIRPPIFFRPTPAISTLSPVGAVVGGSNFTLTVFGTQFSSAATVQWAGSNRATTFISSTQLTATILAADIAAIGQFTVTVSAPPLISTAAALVSNGVTFNVVPDIGNIISQLQSVASSLPTNLQSGFQSLLTELQTWVTITQNQVSTLTTQVSNNQTTISNLTSQNLNLTNQVNQQQVQINQLQAALAAAKNLTASPLDAAQSFKNIIDQIQQQARDAGGLQSTLTNMNVQLKSLISVQPASGTTPAAAILAFPDLAAPPDPNLLSTIALSFGAIPSLSPPRSTVAAGSSSSSAPASSSSSSSSASESGGSSSSSAPESSSSSSSTAPALSSSSSSSAPASSSSSVRHIPIGRPPITGISGQLLDPTSTLLSSSPSVRVEGGDVPAAQAEPPPSPSPAPRSTPTAGPSVASPLDAAQSFKSVIDQIQQQARGGGLQSTLTNMNVELKTLISVQPASGTTPAAAILAFPDPTAPPDPNLLSTVTLSYGAIPNVSPPISTGPGSSSSSAAPASSSSSPSPSLPGVGGAVPAAEASTSSSAPTGAPSTASPLDAAQSFKSVVDQIQQQARMGGPQSTLTNMNVQLKTLISVQPGAGTTPPSAILAFPDPTAPPDPNLLSTMTLSFGAIPNVSPSSVVPPVSSSSGAAPASAGQEMVSDRLRQGAGESNAARNLDKIRGLGKADSES